VRTTLTQPVPPPLPGDPVAAFERQVAAGDATSTLLEQLARLASSSRAGNLLIETGERVSIAADGAGPRLTGAAPTDPRLQLFAVPLAYSPVSMSFDADYASLGEFLWRLRDLATTVEIRTMEVKPRAASAAGPEPAVLPVADGAVHVALTLFAYSREATATHGGSAPVPPPASPTGGARP
jgi:hypothetical protein